MNLEPFEDRVVIQPDEAPKEIGGIIVPDTVQDQLKPAKGTIIAVGPGLSTDPVMTKIYKIALAFADYFSIPVPKSAQDTTIKIEIGDRVLHGKYAGTEYEIEPGKKVLIMRTTDLIAKI